MISYFTEIITVVLIVLIPICIYKIIKGYRKRKHFEELKNKMSLPTKIIKYGNGEYVMVNERTSQIMLNENIYNFGELLSYQGYDSSKEIVETTQGESSFEYDKSSRKWIGTHTPATTTKKTVHDYSIAVTTNRLSKPMEMLNFGGDGLNMLETKAVLSLIIPIDKRKYR